MGKKKAFPCKACGLGIHIICSEATWSKQFQRLKESHAKLLKTLTIKFLQGTNFNNTPVVRQIRQAEKLQKELS